MKDQHGLWKEAQGVSHSTSNSETMGSFMSQDARRACSWMLSCPVSLDAEVLAQADQGKHSYLYLTASHETG